LSVTDGIDADDDAPYQRLLKAASDPNFPPVDMDALERKIRRQLLTQSDEPTLDPPSSPALSTSGLPLDTPPHSQLETNPAEHPDHTTITLHPTKPLAKPRVPPDPHQPTIPNLPAVELPTTNNLPVPKTLRPKPRRKTPPSPSARPSKQARITLYFSTHPSGPLSPCPSTPLPPFNPVPMCTPDKYTQHNFCPP